MRIQIVPGPTADGTDPLDGDYAEVVLPVQEPVRALYLGERVVEGGNQLAALIGQGVSLETRAIDGADPNPDRQIEAVHSVLREIGADEIPEQLVINKTDVADPVAIRRLSELHPEAVATSAVTGAGMDDLSAAITARLAETTDEIKMVVPYERGDLVALVHDIGRVASTEHTDAGTAITASVPSTELHRFSEFIE